MIKQEKELIKAIRSKCYECCGQNKEEVKLCTVKTCPLFSYRLKRLITKRRRKR